MMFSRTKLFFVLPLLMLLFVACGAQSREKTLKTTFVGVNAAREGFLVWDRAQQTKIVDEATTFEDGRRDLLIYAERRAPVVEAFNVAYQAIALAALDPDAANLDEAVVQAKLLFESIKKLTGRI